MQLPGDPSDDVDGVLAAGRGDIGTLFVSMARRHPEGSDADYLRWHTLDHRPEQHRLSAVRASLRLVSTPDCRAARAAADHEYDPIDHVMTYFFTDEAGLKPFNDLSKALGNAGRKLTLLPPVQRGVFTVQHKQAAPRVKVGADVLPWWPALGCYVLVETAGSTPVELLDVEGVVGLWSAALQPVEAASPAGVRDGQSITYCFLDEDPVAVAQRLRPVLRARWINTDSDPLLAAPFYAVVPHQWNRYVP